MVKAFFYGAQLVCSLFGKRVTQVFGYNAAAVAYMAGSRRVYDLLISRLAVDETEVFNLAAMTEAKREDDLFNDLTQI